MHSKYKLISNENNMPALPISILLTCSYIYSNADVFQSKQPKRFLERRLTLVHEKICENLSDAVQNLCVNTDDKIKNQSILEVYYHYCRNVCFFLFHLSNVLFMSYMIVMFVL